MMESSESLPAGSGHSVSVSRQVTKDQIFLEIAVLLGQLGTCDRGRVGAIILRDGRAVSWGFNGAPPGMPHCSENQHGWLGVDQEDPRAIALHESGELNVGDSVSQAFAARYGCRNATHAEANALAFAARQGISTEGGTCYVECSPCVDCARLLVAAGISRVVFRRAYRDPSGVDLLSAAGVVVDEVH